MSDAQTPESLALLRILLARRRPIPPCVKNGKQKRTRSARTAERVLSLNLAAGAGFDAAIYPFELLEVYVLRQRVHGFLPSASFPTFTNVTVQQ